MAWIQCETCKAFNSIDLFEGRDWACGNCHTTQAVTKALQLWEAHVTQEIEPSWEERCDFGDQDGPYG